MHDEERSEHRVRPRSLEALGRAILSRRMYVFLASLAAAIGIFAVAPVAQEPTNVVLDCPPPGAAFANPPEIRTVNGVLKGAIYLNDERQRLMTTVNGNGSCSAARVRSFRLEPPKEPRDRNEVRDPMPGPTLRARVGDLVQLTFINQIDLGFFERSRDLDTEACASVKNGSVYPTPFEDTYPNCLHASSTANIHFHGTHTNPNSTGDNVYLQVRPLPRNNQGRLTTTVAEATAGFEQYFKECTTQLKASPVKSWPITWRDLPKAWADKQTELLKAYQAKNPTQPLWDANVTVLNSGGWPVHYIGAFPFCFALPAYPGPSGNSPVMGQLPGTHWYHAHKHGSTAINVMNGMTGAFIIEGKYDDDLNDAYRSYVLTSGPWNTRSQKVMVLNQLGTVPNALNNSFFAMGSGVDFTVNGRLNPKLQMQPGEVQLWRIVNTSGRTAAYFMPPEGLEWRQIAQDGVQYNDENYQASLNRPFYMAPANRIDLLVKAPRNPPSSPITIRIQHAMSRSTVVPNPPQSDTRELLTVEVAGPPVTKDGQPAEMPFLTSTPEQPAFLKDITEEEFQRGGSIRRTFEFNSKMPQTGGRQHTINGIQFHEPNADVKVTLGTVEEWTIVNTTNTTNGPFTPIDHPLHIHINPFQVTEMFDPNEKFVDTTTGAPTFRYEFDKDVPLVNGQCRLKLDDKTTWKPCGNTKQGHWWDVFAMPAARDVNGTIVPGYFKMRSRYVDYPGVYVMHCHILIHEDRGMMFSVEVVKPTTVVHH